MDTLKAGKKGSIVTCRIYRVKGPRTQIMGTLRAGKRDLSGYVGYVWFRVQGLK